MTNKILLEEILKEQKIQAQKQLQLSSDFSNFMNKQSAFNQKISSLLFADSETNRAGYLANHDALDKRVLDLEVKNKITAGKVAISIVIISAIGSVIWKLISILD